MNSLAGRATLPVLTLAIASASCLTYGVMGRDAQLFGPSVSRGPGLRKSIALTFDDGPSPGTQDVAEYLAHQGVRATFFQCGVNVLRHSQITFALVEAGHEVGNHTHTHPRLCPRLGWKLNLLSPREVYAEFARAQTILEDHAGVSPRLLRAPYGLRWLGMREAQRRLKLLGVTWTVIGHDWEWEAERVASHVVAQATPGGIVCLHDGRDTRQDPDISVTLAAVRRIVPRLIDLGYSFETVSEILRA